jgi:hypothetical protein
MLIHIRDNFQVSDLKDRFEKCFQELTIEFFFSTKNTLDAVCLAHKNQRIADIRTQHVEGDLPIKSWYTVKQVKQEFADKYGLNIEIYRRENNSWVNSSRMEDITLRELEDISRRHAMPMLLQHSKTG